MRLLHIYIHVCHLSKIEKIQASAQIIYRAAPHANLGFSVRTILRRLFVGSENDRGLGAGLRGVTDSYGLAGTGSGFSAVGLPSIKCWKRYQTLNTLLKRIHGKTQKKFQIVLHQTHAHKKQPTAGQLVQFTSEHRINILLLTETFDIVL